MWLFNHIPDHPLAYLKGNPIKQSVISYFSNIINSFSISLNQKLQICHAFLLILHLHLLLSFITT
jgi:hypothetical protein